MDRANTQQSDSRSVVSSRAYTCLSGTWLIIARTVWLVLVVPSLGLFVVGLPAYTQQVQKPCVDATTCSITGALTATGLRALAALGISASGYATFYTVFWAVIFVIWCGVGFFIFWRKSDDGMALLAAFFLVLFNAGATIPALSIAYPALTLPIVLMDLLGPISLLLFFLLFPNGRLVPRWMGLVIPLGIMQAVLFVAPPTSLLSQNNWPGWFNALLAFLTYGSIIVSQIYRYRRVSTRVERQQTKWVVFAITMVVAGFLVFGALFNVVFPVVQQPDSPYSFILLAYPFLLLLLPVCIGIAILRYRLWDIDVLINRTLVYGTLMASLALIYVGSILLLQFLLSGFTGGNSLAIVTSTLAIAALFQPLRQRIQQVIDRRFYRSKYDAARTLAAFSATLRNEVDLDQLREELLAVVQETMQPASLSLWIRPLKLQASGEEIRGKSLSGGGERPNADHSDAQ